MLRGLGICLVLVILSPLAARAQKGEPPALNPFAVNPNVSGEREDALPGYIELSDGSIHYGRIYLTRDKRLKIRDTTLAEERQREVPLQVVKQIQCTVKKEWMEKEWRFKELALNEKLYTGRSYPVRECEHTITLRDDRTIKGELSGIVYLIPGDIGPPKPGEPREDVAPEHYLIHKDQKGTPGQTLREIVYVKTIKLGDEAYKEGRRKAMAKPSRGARYPRR